MQLSHAVVCMKSANGVSYHRCQQRPGGDQLTGGQAPLIAICSGAAAVAVEWENN